MKAGWGNVVIDIQMDIEEAKAGRQAWLEIKYNHSFDSINDCLVILPSQDRSLNQAALKEIPDYLVRKYLGRAIIVSSDMLREDERQIAEKRKLIFVHLGEKQCNQLLKYYRLTQFTKNILVVSLEEPYGNGNIIGKEGITLEDYIRDAIFV